MVTAFCLLPTVYCLLVFPLGLLIGSFLNVCIYRLPKEESAVRPRSRCPHCGHPIRWYDNIPVLSFVRLAGRCRDCGGAISFLYPAVEIITAVLFTVIAARYDLTLAAIKYAILGSMMIALAFIDLADRILPDEITLGGAVAGFLFSFLLPLAPGLIYLLLSLWNITLPPRLTSVAESLGGAVIASGMLYIIAEIYRRLRSREGMGLGDVKMMAMIGAFLGLRYAILALMLASILGAILGLIFILIFRKGLLYELPFGTFLAFASILMVVLFHETS